MVKDQTAEEKFYEEAKKYASCCMENIREMLAKLEHAQQCDGEEIDGEPCEHLNDEEWHDEDGAQRAIDEDPLSIQVRGDWHNPGEQEGTEATHFEILLTTGGPAARIMGELQGGQPSHAWFEYQDWFKPWTEVILDSADRSIMLEYAQRFYYGD